MISAVIILDTRRKSARGYPVKIRVHRSGSKVHKYIKTGIYQWGEKLEMTLDIKKRDILLQDELNFVNENRLNLESAIEVFENGIADNKAIEILVLKRKLAELQSYSSIGFIQFLDVRIAEKKQLKESTRAYEDVRAAVLKFLEQDDIGINVINYEWLSSFIRNKKSAGATSGVNSYLRTMRAVYKEAQKRESLNIKRDNPFLGLIKIVEKGEVSPDISADDLKALMVYQPQKGVNDLKKDVIKRNTDLFLFQFAIGGHDYADIARLQWSNLKNGRIKFKRFKNRNKPGGGSIIDNMLNDFAVSVIEKYGNKNSKRIFSFIPDPVNEYDYGIYRGNIGRSLATISKNIGFETNLKTKTPRYLFRTFAGNLFIDTFVIMQLQGHTPQGVTFGYQRALPYDILDKEHQKILDLVFDRNFII